MKVVAHVGQMKSGTTYIQNALHQNREFLLDNGFIYPGKLFNQQHACYGLCGSDIPWVENTEKWKSLGKEVLSEIEESDKNVILSSEALSSMNEEGVKRFVDKIGRIDRVILTVRNFQRVVLSAWQQYVKGGGLKSLEDFIDVMRSDRLKKQGIWRKYCFGDMAKVWSEHAQVCLIVVGSDAQPGEFIANFSSQLGISQIPEPKLSVSQENTSLKLEDVELLRFFNSLNGKMDKQDRDAYVRWLLNKAMFPATKGKPGSKITMPQQYVDEISGWAYHEVQKVTEKMEVIGDLSEIYKIDKSYISQKKEFSAEDHAVRANVLFNTIFENIKSNKLKRG